MLFHRWSHLWTVQFQPTQLSTASAKTASEQSSPNNEKSSRNPCEVMKRNAGHGESLAWTLADLFGLHTPPDKPHPSCGRLSRCDCTGFVWLLQDKQVVALTADTATIRNPATGSLTTYRRFNIGGTFPRCFAIEHRIT
jgi:hypothetical protein